MASPPAASPAEVAAQLALDFPDAACELDFENPFQLLIATILSAQCTDERVNQVTRPLFEQHPAAADLAALAPADLEELVRPTGFYRNKAKNIQACCRALLERHEGQVPRDLKHLVQLPGVGRKTANLVLGVAFGIPSGMVVDTHVARVTRRLGLTAQTNADKAEQDLNALLPQSQWIELSHRLILHGRRVCRAKRPLCDQCSLRPVCPQIGVDS